MISKPSLYALKLLEKCGIRDPTELPLETIVQGLGAFYVEKPLKHCEGRIVSLNKKTLITINSNISYLGKKRYAIAHEIGHFEMHKDSIPVITDTEVDFIDYLKKGPHEQEANEFAAELLMPRDIFRSECLKKPISPELIRYLSTRFQTSLTSTVLRYIEFGNHQSCVIYCKDNKMKWWKKSVDFYNFINFQYDSSPPVGSVAYEVFTKGKFLSDIDQKQQIWKSDWFVLNENDQDLPFFEYCIYVPSYNYTLSIIWEENKKVRISM